MSDTAITTIEQPSRQRLAAKGRSEPLKVTGKLRKAIEYMVFEGSKTDYKSAAEKAGLTAHAIRLALDRPHVKAFYRQLVEVLRTAEEARTIHRFAEIRDAADNMPAVQAGKELLRTPDESSSNNKGFAPGFCVQIVNVQQASSMPHTPTIEAKPLIDNEDVHDA